ncbi:MAG: TadE/TadG family type IV pilus assembly protein [Myxococcota bacterium]
MPRSRRGGNAIEFAMLLPVFLLLLFAIMDFGWLFFNHSAANSATARACRDGSLQDPGQNNANLSNLIADTETAMRTHYTANGGTAPIDMAVVTMAGAAPQRALNCRMEVSVPSFFGSAALNFFDGSSRSFDTMTVAAEVSYKLEFQR